MASLSWRELIDARFYCVAAVCVMALAILSAIPTAIIDNPWFTRMTPVYPDQYIFWLLTSVLGGVLIATYTPGMGFRGTASGVGGGFLGYLAIGCPICNKLIVGLIGISGALTFFQPIQPILGGVGVTLVGVALAYRLRDLKRGGCRATSR